MPSSEILKQIKELYLDYIHISKIAKTVNLTEPTINYHIRKLGIYNYLS